MKKNSGYTLAELLIVITIVAILSILILLSLNPFVYTKRAYDTRRKDDIHRLRNVLEDYYADHEYYPDLKTILTHCGGSDLMPYLDKVPCDPTTKTPYPVYTLPVGSTKPQEYAIYAPTTSPNFADANNYIQCPDTLVVNSPNMTKLNVVVGCGGKLTCSTYYGCRDGACVIVSFDSEAICTPNSCDTDCGGVDCSAKNGSGSYINECVAP